MEVCMIGLGAMGKNLALNMQDKGVDVVGYDVSKKAREAAREAGLEVSETVQDADIYWIMVPDKFVGEVLEKLNPKKGAVIVEGGNSHYKKTEERVKWARENGFNFLGTGVSGGEEGARNGPCIMPGGDGYKKVKSIMEKMAAKVDGEPCVAYMGEGGAGHYVKMVHNGIEYAIMEAIAEAYHLLIHAGFTYQEMHEVFKEWSETERLGGYLMEITADILGHEDRTGKPFVEIVKDKASQKGTGKWTSQEALDLGIPASLLTSAVYERYLSAHKDLRAEASELIDEENLPFGGDRELLLKELEEALYFTILTAYSQGFMILKSEYDLEDIARIWRGGCIIRSPLLDKMMPALKDGKNLLLADMGAAEACEGLRSIASTAHALGVPIPVMGQALSYFDSLRHERLPSAAMIQAMRDYFGSHTYERIDQDGSFHTDWAGDRKER